MVLSDIPFLCIKFCDTGNFLKHRSVPQWIFSVLCDKNLSTEKRNTPPLWCLKILDTRNFLMHRSVPQPIFSVLWDKKFWLKMVICPLLSIKIYLIPKSFFWKTEGFLYKAFRSGRVRQKISTENRDTPHPPPPPPPPPPPLASISFFRTRKILKHRMVPWRSFFRSCEIKNIFDKTVKLSFAWKFSIPEFFRNTEMFSYEFYWHCETKIFQRSSVVSPFLCKKLCDTRNFLKHRSVPQRIFSVLCDKKLSTEKRNTPPLWCFKIFDTRVFLIHRSVTQPNFSVLWDKNFSTEKRDTPLFINKTFRNQKCSQKQ